MKYAYYPGCSAKGTCPELDKNTYNIASALNIKLMELSSASCCGAGVIGEKDPDLAITLNARIFAQAEQMGLDILTVCGTCQGVLSGTNKELKEDDALWARTNEILQETIGITYNRTIEVIHIMMVLNEPEIIKQIESRLAKNNPLKGLKIAPFYGCHILRPSSKIKGEDPENPCFLEDLIYAVGATPVDYSGKLKCCGFPLVLEKENIASKMIGHNMLEAKKNGANMVVTPCPLCHMNLDIYQHKGEQTIETALSLPILHLPQMIALALGFSARESQLSRHIVPVSI